MLFSRTGYGSLLALATALLGWGACAREARADLLVSGWREGTESTRATSPTGSPLTAYQAHDSGQDVPMGEELSEEERERLEAELALATTMALFFFDTPPPPIDIPKPPPQVPPTTPDHPHPSGPPPTAETPEPVSLLTGLLGSGILGALAVARRRRRKAARAV
jgi:hypothetical protein